MIQQTPIKRQSDKPRCPKCRLVLRRNHECKMPKPVKAKRKGTRRGRVVDRQFLDWMATQPCCVTGRFDATTHHVRSFGSPKDDRHSIRLVDYLHMRTHKVGQIPCVEDGKRLFEAYHGLVIETEIAKVNARYTAETGRP